MWPHGLSGFTLLVPLKGLSPILLSVEVIIHLHQEKSKTVWNGKIWDQTKKWKSRTSSNVQLSRSISLALQWCASLFPGRSCQAADSPAPAFPSPLFLTLFKPMRCFPSQTQGCAGAVTPAGPRRHHTSSKTVPFKCIHIRKKKVEKKPNCSQLHNRIEESLK